MEKRKCLLAILKIIILCYFFGFLIAMLLISVSNSKFIVYLISPILNVILLTFLALQEKKKAFGLWDFSGKLNWKIVVGSVLMGCVLYGVGLLFNELFHIPIEHQNFDIAYFFLQICTSVFLAAFIEELFCRKFVITSMEESGFPPIVVLLFSSILFYLGHVNFFVLDFHPIETFIIGVIIFFLYTKTREIRYCMIVHATGNLLAIIYQTWIV